MSGLPGAIDPDPFDFGGIGFGLNGGTAGPGGTNTTTSNNTGSPSTSRPVGVAQGSTHVGGYGTLKTTSVKANTGTTTALKTSSSIPNIRASPSLAMSPQDSPANGIRTGFVGFVDPPASSPSNNNGVARILQPSSPVAKTGGMTALTVLRDWRRTPEEGGMVSFRNSGRIVYFARSAEADFFERVLREIKDGSDGAKGQPRVAPSVLKVLRDNVSVEAADAIVKIAMGSPNSDFIMIYSARLPINVQKARARSDFEKLLLQNHIFLEHQLSTDRTKYYVKMYVAFDRLIREAETQKLKFPLTSATDGSAFFRRDKLKLFAGGNRPMEEVMLSFFTSTQRISLAMSIISSIRLKTYLKGKSDVGMTTLLTDKVYMDFFPLHEGPWDNTTTNKNSNRQILKNRWAHSLFRAQPLNMIRDYFGEKVVFYFAFFGFYTKHLSYAAVFGCGVFAYGVWIHRSTLDSAEEISADSVSQVFDNALTVVYAIMMSYWASFFLELWKRKQTTLAYRWNVLNFDKEEHARADWRSNHVRKSPVTGKWERYQSPGSYQMRMIVSGLCVFLCVCVIMSASVLCMLFKPWAQTTYPEDETLYQLAPYIGSAMSVVSMIVLGAIYGYINVWLTLFENHQTESQFETSFVTKRFIVDFINSYSSLFYIGLVKPTMQSTLIPDGLLKDTCTYNSCMVDLLIQLGTNFAVMQLGYNTLYPWAMAYIFTNARKYARQVKGDKRKEEQIPQWELDENLYKLDSLTNEYSSLVVQFGYVLLFSASFPLGPFFAAIANVLQIRFHAVSMLRDRQRPIPLRAKGIGQYHRIFSIMTYIAILTNGCLICFTSQFFKYNVLALIVDIDDAWKLLIARLGLVMIFEHIILISKGIISFLIPDMTLETEIAIAKEDYQAKIVLEGLKPAEDEEAALSIIRQQRLSMKMNGGGGGAVKNLAGTNGAGADEWF